jgi:hypothetical protein
MFDVSKSLLKLHFPPEKARLFLCAHLISQMFVSFFVSLEYISHSPADTNQREREKLSGSKESTCAREARREGLKFYLRASRQHTNHNYLPYSPWWISLLMKYLRTRKAIIPKKIFL